MAKKSPHTGLMLSLAKLLCSFNIPRAKRELAQLNKRTSPQQKLVCLRKVVQLITQSPSQRGLCWGRGLVGRAGADTSAQMQRSVKEQCCLKGSYRWAHVQPARQGECPGVCSEEWVPTNGGGGWG